MQLLIAAQGMGVGDMGHMLWVASEAGGSCNINPTKSRGKSQAGQAGRSIVICAQENHRTAWLWTHSLVHLAISYQHIRVLLLEPSLAAGAGAGL